LGMNKMKFLPSLKSERDNMAGFLGRGRSKVYIIAEAGVNHNGRLDLAKRHVDAAAMAGANAVKFQTFITEVNQSSVHLPKNYLKWAKSMELSFDQFRQLSHYCRVRKIQFLSTPFETTSAEFLNTLVPVFKISSGEITNLPLLECVAKKGKPIILSTGMASLEDVAIALKVIKRNFPKNNPSSRLSQKYEYFRSPVVLLHCVSEYPTPFQHENLLAMQELYKHFQTGVGLSDHTLGIEAPIAACALGACVIEKHFTIDKKLPGPDHPLSLDPIELKQMVDSIRNIEKALGTGQRRLVGFEKKLIKIARKSLVASRDLVKGEIITKDKIYVMRPGSGIPPKETGKVIGCLLIKNMKKDEMFRWESIRREGRKTLL